MKLNDRQLAILQEAKTAPHGYYPGPGAGASTCRALIRRGLMFKVKSFGPYMLTPAGEALAE